MPHNSNTSVRSRQVAAALREFREEAGLSCAELGKLLGISGSKISRMETGVSGLQYADVAAMLGFYRVPPARRDELLDMLQRSEERGWWERQPGLPKLWRSLINFEAKAARLQNYESLVIPGLLQTAEYSRALMAGANPTLSDAELDNLIAARMARQAVLTKRNAPNFLAVMDEGVLRRPIGEPGVMTRQLRHLLDSAQRQNISLRMVPNDAGAHAGLRGPFVILEFAEEPDLILVENQITGLFLEEDADLAGYRLALSNILAVADAPHATLDRIDGLLAEHA